MTIVFCKAAIKRIEIDQTIKNYSVYQDGANESIQLNFGRPLSVKAYAEGDVPVPTACLGELSPVWSIRDISGRWDTGMAIELDSTTNAPNYALITG